MPRYKLDEYVPGIYCIFQDDSDGEVHMFVSSRPYVNIPGKCYHATSSNMVGKSYPEHIEIWKRSIGYAHILDEIDIADDNGYRKADLFAECGYLMEITGLENVNVSRLKYMGGMFAGCEDLQFVEGLRTWDTSNVVSVRGMFRGCRNLNKSVVDEIENWDTRNIENVEDMFYGTKGFIDAVLCEKWNLPKIQQDHNPFFHEVKFSPFLGVYRCDVRVQTPEEEYLTTYISPHECNMLSGSVSPIKEGNACYYAAVNIPRMTIIDDVILNSVSKGLFREMPKIKNIEGLDKVDVSQIEHMNWMFSGCSQLEHIIGAENWNVSNAVDMSGMFWGCEKLTDFSFLSAWDTKNLTVSDQMFNGSGINDLYPLSIWDMSHVRTTCRMFANTDVGNASPISGWDMGQVAEMDEMFAQCQNIRGLASLDKWNIHTPSIVGFADYLPYNGNGRYDPADDAQRTFWNKARRMYQRDNITLSEAAVANTLILRFPDAGACEAALGAYNTGVPIDDICA